MYLTKIYKATYIVFDSNDDFCRKTVVSGSPCPVPSSQVARSLSNLLPWVAISACWFSAEAGVCVGNSEIRTLAFSACSVSHLEGVKMPLFNKQKWRNRLIIMGKHRQCPSVQCFFRAVKYIYLPLFVRYPLQTPGTIINSFLYLGLFRWIERTRDSLWHSDVACSSQVKRSLEPRWMMTPSVQPNPDRWKTIVLMEDSDPLIWLDYVGLVALCILGLVLCQRNEWNILKYQASAVSHKHTHTHQKLLSPSRGLSH